MAGKRGKTLLQRNIRANLKATWAWHDYVHEERRKRVIQKCRVSEWMSRLLIPCAWILFAVHCRKILNVFGFISGVITSTVHLMNKYMLTILLLLFLTQWEIHVFTSEILGNGQKSDVKYNWNSVVSIILHAILHCCYHMGCLTFHMGS